MKKFESKFLSTLQERGFIQDCTDAAGLDNYFIECEKTAKPAVAYIGFDCTATSLHAGSLMQIMVLRWLQKCGHKPIVLLGGGTTKIGDPSGKDETRKILTDADIETNKKGIKKNFESFIKFGQGDTDAILVDNNDWLKTLDMFSYLREIGRHFSLNRMLSMDSVKLRLERDQEMSFIEFNYMILQAYDFAELAKKYACRLQIGGSDQWGNIVNGTDLYRRLNAAPSSGFQGNAFQMSSSAKNNLFGLTTPLLTTSSGAKMGKTADGAIWLGAEMLKPYDYWQYWRNTSDADVGKFLRLFTELPLDAIAKLEQHTGAEINEAKIILANEVTKLLHGEEAAKKAEQTAKEVFTQGGIGDDLPVHIVEKSRLDAGISVAQLFNDAGLFASRGEAKDRIKQGGASVNDEKITDISLLVNSSHMKDGIIKLSAGKKKHALVKVK